MEHVFTLEPDEPEEPAGRPVRVVATGIAPTAEVPGGRQRDPGTVAMQPCATCGQPVIGARSTWNTAIFLDPHTATYVVQWDPGTPMPRAVPSRGYAVHTCRGAP